MQAFKESSASDGPQHNNLHIRGGMPKNVHLLKLALSSSHSIFCLR